MAISEERMSLFIGLFSGQFFDAYSLRVGVLLEAR